MTKGQRIKKRREELLISQTELARRVGITKHTLYKYENDIITNIPSDNLEKIAKALDVSPSYIFGWKEKHDYTANTEQEQVFIELFESAPSDVQDTVLRFLKYSKPDA